MRIVRLGRMGYNGAPMATKPITELLSRCSAGDGQAQDAVFELAFKDLRKLAKAYLRSERPNHTLQPTALVNEAYLRILKGSRPKLQNRAHFLAVAARAMRQVLVDHARKVKAVKRRGAKISLESALACVPQQSAALLALDEDPFIVYFYSANQSLLPAGIAGLCPFHLQVILFDYGKLDRTGSDGKVEGRLAT